MEVRSSRRTKSKDRSRLFTAIFIISFIFFFVVTVIVVAVVVVGFFFSSLLRLFGLADPAALEEMVEERERIVPGPWAVLLLEPAKNLQLRRPANTDAVGPKDCVRVEELAPGGIRGPPPQ